MRKWIPAHTCASMISLIASENRSKLGEMSRQLFTAARSWLEQNPMLGTRGVRLGILKADLYKMQVPSIVGAARHRAASGVEQPDLKMNGCGEHGGDPQSIALFVELGLDYVSFSPFRVPIARLAVAQAIVGASAFIGGLAPSDAPRASDENP